MGFDGLNSFQIKRPYVFSGSEFLLTEAFKALPAEKMYDFWKETNNGAWGALKKNLKDHYIKVQGFQCSYCLQTIEVFHNGAWDAEHIIPRITHPQFSFEPLNICVSCKDCNSAKHDKKVVYARVKSKFSKDSDDYLICHPHFDEYSDHIRVISIAGFYMPKTIKGKNLIEMCGLLRFLFKFSGFECDISQIQKKTFELNNILQETNDPLVMSYVFASLEDLGREGRRLLRERKLVVA
ncbi:HNH endonuclease [Pseudomonas helleri]|uniref:HNH endonuclease n=1 Tax=Pseudomonas helleri TaxID=1608996 RepID=UPI00243062B1|nr:HNH endonuclease [Pseudomonas helleri]